MKLITTSGASCKLPSIEAAFALFSLTFGAKRFWSAKSSAASMEKITTMYRRVRGENGWWNSAAFGAASEQKARIPVQVRHTAAV
eukprot:jgi/Chrzof1/3055/Cz12g10030.t1